MGSDSVAVWSIFVIIPNGTKEKQAVRTACFSLVPSTKSASAAATHARHEHDPIKEVQQRGRQRRHVSEGGCVQHTAGFAILGAVHQAVGRKPFHSTRTGLQVDG